MSANTNKRGLDRSVTLPSGSEVVIGLPNNPNLYRIDKDNFLSETGVTDNIAATALNTSLRTGMSTVNSGAILTADVVLTAAEIVGTAAGDLGHADGAILVAAPGAGFALQFVSAVLIYDYDTAAYTDGAGDDLTVYINSVAVSGAIATADLITKAGDTVISLSPLSTDYVLGVNSTINLASTAVTNPGTAAGVIRVAVSYRVITTGL